MNPLEIRDPQTIVKLDISTQEKIRLLFRLGFTRSEIAKTLGVKYQVVFKGTNPKYSPEKWKNLLSTLLEREKSSKVVDVEEVEEISTDSEVETEEVSN